MNSGVHKIVQGSAHETDDELRRLAGKRLAQHLELGAILVAHCEKLALTAQGDRLGPLYAAARLMRANAQVADTLAHVALVERRRRSIVERIQSPGPETSELNSILQEKSPQRAKQAKNGRALNGHGKRNGASVGTAGTNP